MVFSSYKWRKENLNEDPHSIRFASEDRETELYNEAAVLFITY